MLSSYLYSQLSTALSASLRSDYKGKYWHESFVLRHWLDRMKTNSVKNQCKDIHHHWHWCQWRLRVENLSLTTQTLSLYYVLSFAYFVVWKICSQLTFLGITKVSVAGWWRFTDREVSQYVINCIFEKIYYLSLYKSSM